MQISVNKDKSRVGIKGFHIEEQTSVFDIICGMELDINQVKFWVTYKGQIYYFCSENCKEHFINNPSMYLVV
ncbi:YHS domain-containing protein [candidate division WWE3 bacterium]|jgi:YHS domain-containing protein|uniref:YHS domain-containing protein n=1 Tax=candidate division WWE3 bacterium TaxID=2053526 RepID=A0A3A4ZA75_UNCKA|nr:MAG: YHS domain-containing protein [candidate division WWE3 bacterium]